MLFVNFFFSPTVSTDIWNQFQCLNVVLNNKTGPLSVLNSLMRNFERCQEKLLLIFYFKNTVLTIVTTKRVQHTLRHFNVLISLSEYFAHSYNLLGTEKGNDYSACNHGDTEIKKRGRSP